MKSVHVELPDETVDVLVSEIFREYFLFKELDVFDRKLSSRRTPFNDLVVSFVLRLEKNVPREFSRSY